MKSIELPQASISKVMQACTVLIVLAYAWLAAFSLEPRFPAPAKMLKEIHWIIAGNKVDTREARAWKFLEVSRISTEVNRAAQAIEVLGGLPAPASLVINADEPERYTIAYDHIEIGLALAQKEGELERAVLKAWIYQNGNSKIASSLFRLNVAADTLAAVIDGDDPLDSPVSWIHSAASFAKGCTASWQPAELKAVCGTSKFISPFSFRSLLVSVLVRAQAELPVLERIEFLRIWAQSLANAHSLTPLPQPWPTALNDWRGWLRAEAFAIVGNDPRIPSFPAALAAELSQVQLGDSTKLTAEFGFHGGSASALDDRTKSRRAFLVYGVRQAILYPGEIELTASEAKSFTVQTLVWESCEAPKLGEITATAASERLLFIRNCEKPGAGWPALFRGGLRQFAKEQPNVPFLLLKKDQIALAISRGEMDPQAPLSRYMERDAKFPLLGLANAEWRRDLKAYRALGAIEAIEWFRELPL